VHADAAEVVSEASLHEGTGARVEGLAGGSDNLVHNGRHVGKSALGCSMALEAEAFGAAGGALSVRARYAPAGAFPV
jgi:hypothetical protein